MQETLIEFLNVIRLWCLGPQSSLRGGKPRGGVLVVAFAFGCQSSLRGNESRGGVAFTIKDDHAALPCGIIGNRKTPVFRNLPLLGIVEIAFYNLTMILNLFTTEYSGTIDRTEVDPLNSYDAII
jgi:hypothetical protein